MLVMEDCQWKGIDDRLCLGWKLRSPEVGSEYEKKKKAKEGCECEDEVCCY